MIASTKFSPYPNQWNSYRNAEFHYTFMGKLNLLDPLQTEYLNNNNNREKMCQGAWKVTN